MNILRTFFFLLAMLALAGCSSPASRIKKNPELFASFPPDVQEKIRQGQIDVGFTPDMVNIALGAPDRSYTRTTSAGATQIWSYVDYRYSYEQQLARGTFQYRDERGRMRTTSDSVWVDVENRTEYERLRIEFQDGRVVAIEEAHN